MQKPDATSIQEQTAEDRLISRCQAGDTEAFRQLVQRHQPYAFALAFRIVCDEDDAKDVVQEGFIRVWRNLGRFRREMKFTTWLYRIIVNLAYDCMRAETRKSRLFSDAGGEEALENLRDPGTLEDEISNRDLAVRIRALTDGLPPKQRMVFILRDLQDMSMDEIALTLEMSMASVKTNLCYARKQLRDRLVRPKA